MYNIVINYDGRQFNYSTNKNQNEWDDEQYKDLHSKIVREFKIKKEFNLYQNSDGQHEIIVKDSQSNATQNEDNKEQSESKKLLRSFEKVTYLFPVKL